MVTVLKLLINFVNFTAPVGFYSWAGADLCFISGWARKRESGIAWPQGGEVNPQAQHSAGPTRRYSDGTCSGKSLILYDSLTCVSCYSLPLRPQKAQKKHAAAAGLISESLVKNPPAPAMEAVAGAKGALTGPVKASDGYRPLERQTSAVSRLVTA